MLDSCCCKQKPNWQHRQLNEYIFAMARPTGQIEEGEPRSDPAHLPQRNAIRSLINIQRCQK